MAVFFLFVAGLNFALGYACALFLAEHAEGAAHSFKSEALPPFKLPPREEPSWACSDAPPGPAFQSAPTISAPAAATTEALAEHQPADLPAAPDPAPWIANEQAPDERSVDEQHAAETANSQPAEVSASITDFKQELLHYRDRLAALDRRVRDCAESQDAAAIKACLGELQLANRHYLDQQEEVSDRFHLSGAAGDLEPLSRQLTAALADQAERVHRSNEHLEQVDLETNLLVGCQELLDETSRLVDANHAIRDALDEVELQLGRRGDLHVDAHDAPADPLLNLISRVQLEAALDEWWQNDPQREHELTLGLVDLDRIRDFNELHGLEAGDRVVEAVAQIVGLSVEGEQRSARMSGQRFLIMLPDLSARDATQVMERIRQQVEATRFERGGEGLSMTVSCSVAAAEPEDTRPTLLGRAEATLREAKRYGRNRTFLHDGRFPAPVVPPALEVSTRTLSI